jgi:RNA polymerase sigma factor (sigma-70 family)
LGEIFLFATGGCVRVLSHRSVLARHYNDGTRGGDVTEAQNDWLAARFEENRGHLRGVAYRMLGSVHEADDAVQEAWLRLSRAGAEGIENLGGWLTTVVARVCLDMLRSRRSRREESVEEGTAEPVASERTRSDPERELMMADSVGLALMVVLDRLSPAERLAFVLHDSFGFSFEEIGEIVGRSAASARQLASRARRRVQGAPRADAVDMSAQREIVGRFLAALRAGDVEGLVAVLDPEFVFHVDEASAIPGRPREVHGARAWAREAVQFYRGAAVARMALVDGAVGVVVAPSGKLFRVLRFTFANGGVAGIEVVGERERLDSMELAVL